MKPSKKFALTTINWESIEKYKIRELIKKNGTIVQKGYEEVLENRGRDLVKLDL